MIGNAINALNSSTSINVEKPIPGRRRADLTVERAGRGALAVGRGLQERLKRAPQLGPHVLEARVRE
jgi:hypothetical protein